jgi:hypothetical protein
MKRPLLVPGCQKSSHRPSENPIDPSHMLNDNEASRSKGLLKLSPGNEPGRGDRSHPSSAYRHAPVELGGNRPGDIHIHPDSLVFHRRRRCRVALTRPEVHISEPDEIISFPLPRASPGVTTPTVKVFGQDIRCGWLTGDRYVYGLLPL